MTTLTDLTDAITTKLTTALTGVVVAGDPPPQTQRAIKVPAVYIELDELEPLSNNGDGRVLADARYRAHCLVDPAQARPYPAVSELSSRVVLALFGIIRPIPGHGHIRLLRAGPDDFHPGLDGYVSWVVEFGIEINLGALEAAGTQPATIYLSTNKDAQTLL